MTLERTERLIAKCRIATGVPGMSRAQYDSLLRTVTKLVLTREVPEDGLRGGKGGRTT